MARPIGSGKVLTVLRKRELRRAVREGDEAAETLRRKQPPGGRPTVLRVGAWPIGAGEPAPPSKHAGSNVSLVNELRGVISAD
jgi:hypothetical protein